MINKVKVFEATLGAFRGVFAVRISSLTGRATVIAAEPTMAQLLDKIRYESTFETVVADLDEDAPLLFQAADEFFTSIGAEIDGIRTVFAEARRKADYWAAVEEKKSSIPAEERSQKDRIRLQDARDHRERHEDVAESMRFGAMLLSSPWLIREGR